MSDQFKKFAEEIAPFRTLWNSVRISVLAARVQEKWIHVATRLQTSELPSEHHCVHLEPNSECLFFNGLLPIEELGRAAFSLINEGRLQLRGYGISESIYLSSSYAGVPKQQDAYVTWSDPWINHNLDSNFSITGLRRPVLFLNGNNANERFIDFIDQPRRKRLESELRLGQPAFRGLKDLQMRHFQGLELETYSNCNILIACQIPFELKYTSPGIEILVPAHVPKEELHLQAFFEPSQENAQIPLEEIGQNGPGMKRLLGKISWPDGAERVNASLLYDRIHILDKEFGRWSTAGNLSVAADVFFDSEHKLLERGLFSLSKSGNQNFEQAVTRLLTLVGIPAINYSSGNDRRPDISATIMRYGEKPLVLLGECTSERPIDKFSALRQRA
jgi:hypothetical protein